MKKEKYVMICPKCKSTDISRDHTNIIEDAMGLPSMFTCRKCGFTSHVFPEIDISELEHES